MTWKSLKTKGIPWRDYLSKEETARMKAIEAEEAKLNERLFQLKAERKPMESRARARYEQAKSLMGADLRTAPQYRWRITVAVGARGRG